MESYRENNFSPTWARPRKTEVKAKLPPPFAPVVLFGSPPQHDRPLIYIMIPMNPRLPLAIASGKLTATASKLLHQGGGTAAPGLVAEWFEPKILAELTKQLPQGAILISGTNGKTTTARLLAEILKAAGVKTVHNRSGSNLSRGIASTLLERADLSGRLDAKMGIFEVDEAALIPVTSQISPKILILNNLFRDQLDRYFEIDRTLLGWRKVVQKQPRETTIVLNADDPRVATLGRYAKGRVIYFGVAGSDQALEKLPAAADTSGCPDCQAQLVYEDIYLGHQGRYFCTNCTLRRPDLDVAAAGITLQGLQGSSFQIRTTAGQIPVKLGIPGFYNVYNALAAASTAIGLGISPEDIQKGLAGFKAAFGRIERIPVGNKEILLTLVKNPTGFNEVLRMLAGAENEHLLLALNDQLADGTDTSWIWDVDLERLASHHAPITVSGIRAWELANRLRYAGVNQELVTIQPDLSNSLRLSLQTLPKGKTLYILPTYTAMLKLRQILTKMGHVRSFWED